MVQFASYLHIEVSLYATLTFKICLNHIYLYRKHPSLSTATCTPNKHIERTLLLKLRLLLVYLVIGNYRSMKLTRIVKIRVDLSRVNFVEC